MDNILDFDKLKIVDGFYTSSDKFLDIVYEYDGSHTETEQEITFEVNQNIIDITFETYINGHVVYESGNYFTPSYTEAIISNIDIDIIQIKINNNVVELDIESIRKLEKFIKKVI